MKTLLAHSLLSTLSLNAHPLIPREELFKCSPCIAIKISPDGKRLAYIGEELDGTMNLHVTGDLSLYPARSKTLNFEHVKAPGFDRSKEGLYRGDTSPLLIVEPRELSHGSNSKFLTERGMEGTQKITAFTEPEIKGFYWAANNRKIVLLKDKEGTKQFHLYVVDLDSLTLQDLTSSYPRVNAKFFAMSKKELKAMVGLNHRNPKFHDLYLLDLTSNELSLFYQNDRFIDFVLDERLDIAVKIEMNQDSSLTLFKKNDELLFNLSAEDAFHTRCLKFDHQEQNLYLLDNRNCNTTELKKIHLENNLPSEVLGHDRRSDIESVLFDKGRPALFTTYYFEREWHPLSPSIKEEIDSLTLQLGKEIEITDKTLSEEKWIIHQYFSNRSSQFWLYDRPSKRLTHLYGAKEEEPLTTTTPFEVTSRDGLPLVCYLTLPKDPQLPLPLVVIPHGGPFQARDRLKFNPKHEWLVNRGYAVLTVNFRLSSGFGKDFVTCGNGQWGRKAHEDVLDAVEACIESGIADKTKLAVFGGSYGGYEALASLTFTPTFFTCAIATCGPSHLKTVLDKVPFYWELSKAPVSDEKLFFTKNAFIKSMGGDPDKASDLPYLESCSPLNYAHQIERPLLLVHGSNDPIVASSESDQIFAKLQEKKIAALYLTYPDEGHGISKFTNLLPYLAYCEWFLAQHLGGKFEPICEKKLALSSGKLHTHEIETPSLTRHSP